MMMRKSNTIIYKIVELTHPVAITGSEYLETQRTITVPMAILCAARNIHNSPLPHKEKLLASKARAGTCRLGAAFGDQTTCNSDFAVFSRDRVQRSYAERS